MSGAEKAQRGTELGADASWLSWYWLSAVNWRNQLNPTRYLYLDVWRPRGGTHYFTHKEFISRFAIVLTSGGIFGYGISVFIEYLGK